MAINKIEGTFYPLRHQEWRRACQELTPSERDVLYFVRTLDPYSNGIEVSASEIARLLSTEERTVHRSTISRAFKVLDQKGFIDLELLTVRLTVKSKGIHCCDKTTVVREDNNRDRHTTAAIATQQPRSPHNSDINIDRVRDKTYLDLDQILLDTPPTPSQEEKPEGEEGKSDSAQVPRPDPKSLTDRTHILVEPKLELDANKINPSCDLTMSKGENDSQNQSSTEKHEYSGRDLGASGLGTGDRTNCGEIDNEQANLDLDNDRRCGADGDSSVSSGNNPSEVGANRNNVPSRGAGRAGDIVGTEQRRVADDRVGNVDKLVNCNVGYSSEEEKRTVIASPYVHPTKVVEDRLRNKGRLPGWRNSWHPGDYHKDFVSYIQVQHLPTTGQYRGTDKVPDYGDAVIWVSGRDNPNQRYLIDLKFDSYVQFVCKTEQQLKRYEAATSVSHAPVHNTDWRNFTDKEHKTLAQKLVESGSVENFFALAVWHEDWFNTVLRDYPALKQHAIKLAEEKYGSTAADQFGSLFRRQTPPKQYRGGRGSLGRNNA